MTINVDGRTEHLDLPLPDALNDMYDDVARISEALTIVDASIKRRDTGFATPAELASNLESIPLGSVVSTAGGSAAGDGGHGDFDIVEETTLPVDDWAVIGEAGKYAVLRAVNFAVNTKQFGGSSALAQAYANEAGFYVATESSDTFTTEEKNKLDGIASGATANSTDAALLNRANHEGYQAVSTITGLQNALDGKQTKTTVLDNTTASFTTSLETKLNGINLTTSQTDTTLGRVWRTNDLVKVTSNTDSTTGRMLEVGYYGLGTIPPQLADFNTDAAQATGFRTGFFYTASGAANLPFGQRVSGVSLRNTTSGSEWRLGGIATDTSEAGRLIYSYRATNAFQNAEVFHSHNQLALGKTASLARSALSVDQDTNTLATLALLSPSIGDVIRTRGAISIGKGAGVYDVVAASGTPDGRGRVLLANGLHAVLRPPYNIEQFGCRTTDTDISANLQLAFAFCEGHALEIPVGTYTRAKSIDSIPIKNIMLWGHGERSHIFFNDLSSVVRRDFATTNDCDFLGLYNFRISGTALSELNSTNASQCFTGNNIGSVIIDRVIFENLRFMATAFSKVKHVHASRNRLSHVMRDGLRFVESSNVIIDGNTLLNVADDCIAIHSEDSSGMADSSQMIQITNNIATACQCIKVLGAKNAIISHNIMNLSLRSALRLVPQVTDTTEGNTPQFNIIISHNQFIDTFGSRGTDEVVHIGSAQARNFQSISPKPMIAATPYSYNYLNNVDAGGVVNIGAHKIQFKDNIIARTRPSGVNYSSYGFGQLFDGITAGFLSDPVITDADFATHGLRIDAPIVDVLVGGNQLSAGVGKQALRLVINGTANVLDITNLTLDTNNFVDCPGGGVVVTGTGSGAGAVHIKALGNTFDCDPYFRNSGHNSDNTWTSETQCMAINAGSNLVASGNNSFKNCSWTGLSAAAYVNLGRNVVYADAVAHGNNAGNKGVRHLPAARDNVLLPIDGVPTSATFGQVLNTPLTVSAVKPTSGKYVYGHFVTNSDQNVLGTAGSQYVVTGWQRLTTGTNHALNTDWLELRSLTGT